ncbi:MAG: CopD family protein [Limisphaerales bacterium]
MTPEYLVCARAVHFGACLLFFGFLAFDRLIAAPVLSDDKTVAFWNSRLNPSCVILLPVIFLSGLAWFVLVAMSMSGQPPHWDILKTVWTQTLFGLVWKTRFFAWIVAALVLVSGRPKHLSGLLLWLQLLLAAILLGTLAWAGHGLEGSRWHLAADVAHLLVAGLWPAGLLPLAMLLGTLRQSQTGAVALVRRFSALSLAAVSLLAVTGLVNACFLVGSFSNLINQSYGRCLLLKILLFCLALAIAAVNLLRLKPRLSEPATPRSIAALKQLHFNVRAELVLAALIVMVVAVLGILPP